jgi:hypothetical protein
MRREGTNAARDSAISNGGRPSVPGCRVPGQTIALRPLLADADDALIRDIEAAAPNRWLGKRRDFRGLKTDRAFYNSAPRWSRLPTRSWAG